MVEWKKRFITTGIVVPSLYVFMRYKLGAMAIASAFTFIG
jgi:hypothetical protein